MFKVCVTIPLTPRSIVFRLTSDVITWHVRPLHDETHLFIEFFLLLNPILFFSWVRGRRHWAPGARAVPLSAGEGRRSWFRSYTEMCVAPWHRYVRLDHRANKNKNLVQNVYRIIIYITLQRNWSCRDDKKTISLLWWNLADAMWSEAGRRKVPIQVLSLTDTRAFNPFQFPIANF